MNQVTEFRPLTHERITTAGCYVLTTFSPKQVAALSPAIDVMTDLSKVPSATIGADASISEAHQMLITRGVRMLIVTDASRRISGLITANDILGEKPVAAAQKTGVKRAGLSVADIMTTEDELEVLHFKEVLKASVGDIVATLKEAGRAHALVADDGIDGKQKLIGIFSATQIARQLGVTIPNYEIAKTFAEIEAVIAGV